MLQTLPDHIRTVLDEVGRESGVSIIDVRVRGQRDQLLLEVYIDAVHGVTHDDCKAVSDALDARLEHDEWYGRLRSVDVSSPGADTPVRHLWQLTKSIGRSVRVVRTDDTTLDGQLLAVADDGLTLTVVSGKGKSKTVADIVVPAAEIKEARVILAFR